MPCVHNQYNTKLYAVWCAMIQRCNNPNQKQYKDYGGRGIKPCREWEHFVPFYTWAIDNGYAGGLTLERINNDEGYSPSNCRWATMAEQAQNKRISSNNKSGCAGVTWDRQRNKWLVQISANNKTFTLGRFADKKQAIKARKSAEEKYWTASGYSSKSEAVGKEVT